MIWIPLTIPILFHHFQWRIAVALFLFEGAQAGCQVLPWGLVFSWEKLDWNSCVLAQEATTRFPRPITHQFMSFPQKRPSFTTVPPWVACWVRAFNKLFVVVHWRVTCVTVNNGLPRSGHISWISHSRDSHFHNFSHPGFQTPKIRVEGSLVIGLIIGLDFAVNLSLPHSFCVLSNVE